MFRSLLFLLLPIITLTKAGPTVKINDGIIEGHILKTIKGREIAAFEGVPYAKPPIGNLRFEAPQPHEAWPGKWKADKIHVCIQYPHSTGGVVKKIEGHEDCLYVNVYKPNENLNNLDVIVYIHGGALASNYGGLYRPSYLLDENVVFVTFNYRLGPLGFLSLEDEILPGNNGLKDQNLALKWIKQNIRNFGGNPNSITIVGMSAGGVSVHFHTLLPQSKGLFNKVISQSGVPTNPWVFTENSREKAHKLANLLGCSTTTNSKTLKDCLKTRPAQQIVEYVRNFKVFLYNPFTVFGVVVEKNNENAILTEHPLTLMKKKQIADVPILFTFVKCEGLYPAADFPTNMQNFEEMDKKWNDVMPSILDYSDTIPKERLNEVSSKIRQEYLKDKQVTMSTFDEVVEIISDRMFIKDIGEVALMHSKSITSPVYSYKFSYVPQHGHTYFHAPDVKFNCTSHGDDTFNVISPIDFMRTTPEDGKMSDIFIKLWTSFAKNGRPIIDNVNWLPVTKEKEILNYLHIKSPNDIKMEEVENLGRASFWNNLNFTENVVSAEDEL